MKTPNIFISHRWAYSEGYYSLVTKFDNLYWRYYDYSVPEHDPLDLSKRKLIEAQLEEQVRQCNFFIVFAQMAMINSYWVQKEVEFAKKYNKYILGVKPWAYTGNIPLFIQNSANNIVGFNAPSIIKKVEGLLE
ncbi:TIR domain-containing protein [Flectobacillus roseus]